MALKEKVFFHKEVDAKNYNINTSYMFLFRVHDIEYYQYFSILQNK